MASIDELLNDPTKYRRRTTSGGGTYWERIEKPSAVAAPRGSVREGWRVWYTRPAEPDLSLYSAVYGAPNQGLRPEMCRSRSRVMRAHCSVRRHAAPAAGCACGVYTVENVVDGLYRVGAMVSNIYLRDTHNSWWPYKPDHRMAAVLGRVRLHGAVEHDDAGTWSVLSQVKAQIGPSTPVLRAASAEILELFVAEEFVGTAAARELAPRLADAFGVPAQAGYPTFTLEEWHERPAWMTTEPWRQRCNVDAILSRFQPGGPRRPPLRIAFVCQGNICRSPMAEKVLTRQLYDRGLTFAVRCSSAGWDAARHAGAPADERTQRVLRQ